MLVGPHADTRNERQAAPALLPCVVGNIKAAAGFGTFRLGNGTAAQVMAGDSRSRARSGGFGMLWLTALTFSLMKEVRAADPNVTFLDDGNITYKDLEHGAFEIVTKEAIPRHFLVEDPGQTIVLRPQGSTISVNQVTNSPARMAELQAAQQEALDTYQKGLGSTGSSTPPFAEPLPVQPINFIQTDSSSPEQESLSSPTLLFVSVPETIIGRVPPPPPPPPTLNAIAGPIETDTVAFDVFATTSGAFVASSPDGAATLTFGIGGGSTGNTVLDGVTYDVSEAGPYGTLYVDSSTGAYTFVPDSDAINALTEPTTTSFTITVSDGTLSANEVFTIAINGTNDAAVISGATTGSAIEAGDGANAAQGALTATGTLTAADVDNTPNTFTAVSSPTASAGGFGTFMMTAAGVWAYTVDEANSAVQALNVGDTLTDTFTVTTIDGTAQQVTVIIHGANDAAVISGTTTGSVTEDGGPKCGSPTAIGTLTDTDVDNTPNTFTAVGCPTESDAGYGTFTMTAAGVWTYKLDNDNCAVQALDDGDTLTDTFTVTTIDGTTQVVTITIQGANDPDPNDFDYLATGKHIVSDSPYIFGTRGDDVIANCGHHGRVIFTGVGDDTIDATGNCDVVYAGSGNDTIKGNDGDDTIYGGSGSDAIDGGYGCDTIVGGYGADNLTGGKGNDSFVFLSATDSRAARFDVISDFKPGSDRIDLTALGALAFLALTSSSTAVPAHTIAWFYDSTANQTIVYVNPTDHTLSIGDSALLEIHLDGLVTLQASDFVPEPDAAQAVAAAEPVNPELAVAAETDATVVTLAATDASFDWTDGDGTHLAGGNSTTRTASGDGFEFSSDGEVRTHVIECSNDDAEITPASEHSALLHRAHVTTATENNLTSDHTSVREVAIHSTDFSALHDDRAASGRIEHGRTLDDDSWSTRSHTDWTFSFATRSHSRGNDEDHRSEGHGSHRSSTANGDGNWDHGNAADAWGHAFDAGSSIGLTSGFLKGSDNGGSGRHSNSDGSNEHTTPALPDSFHFKGGNSGSGASEVADVHNIWTSSGHRENRSGSSGPSDFSEEAQAIEKSSSGHHWSGHFDFARDQAGNAHTQHDLMV